MDGFDVRRMDCNARRSCLTEPDEQSRGGCGHTWTRDSKVGRQPNSIYPHCRKSCTSTAGIGIRAIYRSWLVHCILLRLSFELLVLRVYLFSLQ